MTTNKYQRFNLYTGSPQASSIENIFLFARQLAIELIVLFIIFNHSTHLIYNNISSGSFHEINKFKRDFIKSDNFNGEII